MYFECVNCCKTICRLLKIMAFIVILTGCKTFEVTDLMPAHLAPFVDKATVSFDQQKKQTLTVNLIGGQHIDINIESFIDVNQNRSIIAADSNPLNALLNLYNTNTDMSNQTNIATIFNSIAPPPTSCGS